VSLSVLGARQAGRLEAGAMQEAAVEAVGGGPAVKRSYGVESYDAMRTGSAIKKENRTVGCLQTRTDTDRQAQAEEEECLRVMREETGVREDRPGQREASLGARRALTLGWTGWLRPAGSWDHSRFSFPFR
jgi:hypothetical protein